MFLNVTIYLFIVFALIYQQARKENAKMRESEEKQRRAREGREKAEAERAARAERKRALVDMNAHEAQEGVMDSLMEALQTGAAFNRPDQQRRKRQTRVAGGKLITIKDRFTAGKIMRHDSTRSRKKIFNGDLASRFLVTPKNKMANSEENKVVEVSMTNQILSPSDVPIPCNGSKQEFFTPEENHSPFKKMLLNKAKMTPKKLRKNSRKVNARKDAGSVDWRLSSLPEELASPTFNQVNNYIASNELINKPYFIETPKMAGKYFENLLGDLENSEALAAAATGKFSLEENCEMRNSNEVISKEDNIRLSDTSTAPKSKYGVISVENRTYLFPKTQSLWNKENTPDYSSAITEGDNKTPDKFPSPSKTSDNKRTPTFSGETSIGVARCVEPMKGNKVVVSKRRKRNSIVRQANYNRKKLLHKVTNNTYVGSPPDMNSSMPIPSGNAFSSPSVPDLNATCGVLYTGISRSVEDLNPPETETHSTPLSANLMRTKNFDNIAIFQDENQNDISIGVSSKLQSSGSISSPKVDFANSINTPDSMRAGEISGIADLSRGSPFGGGSDRMTPTSAKGIGSAENLVSPNVLDNASESKTISLVSETDANFLSPKKRTIDLLESTIFSTEKNRWKFWKKIEDNKDVVAVKYSKLKTGERGDVVSKDLANTVQSVDQNYTETSSSIINYSPDIMSRMKAGVDNSYESETSDRGDSDNKGDAFEIGKAESKSKSPAIEGIEKFDDISPRGFYRGRNRPQDSSAITDKLTSPKISDEMRQLAMRKMNKNAKKFITSQKKSDSEGGVLNEGSKSPSQDDKRGSLLKNVLDSEVQLRIKNSNTSPNGDQNFTDSPSKPLERYNSWRATSMF